MKYHILIADDEDRILKNMYQIIKDAFVDRAEIQLAANGLECIRIMREWTVDLLITDIRMPGLDGIELIQKVRETNSDVEILVISAYEDFNYAKRLIPYGVMDYLVKPISVDQLLGKVKNAMTKASAEIRKTHEEINTSEERYRAKALIKKAKEYIKQQVYHPLSLSDVAEYLHISKSYLSVMFKNEIGENISSYINSEKIKEAKKLLLETEMSVSEISEKLGYSTSKYFIEKFSKSTGISPAKYRGLLNKSIQ